MKIKEILKKQGELYKNMPSSKTILEYNENHKLPKLVKYNNYWILEKECKALIELIDLLGKKPDIIKKQKYNVGFEISIENNKITYLAIRYPKLTCIPKQINNLQNLKKLSFHNNKISKLENLDDLTSLQELWFSCNKEITKIENLDNLSNLKILCLHGTSISKIKNLSGLKYLEELMLGCNNISKIENLDNLQNLKRLELDFNNISKLENLDNLINLEELDLRKNPINFTKEMENLINKGLRVRI